MYEELHTSVDQITDPNNPLPYIDEEHYGALIVLFCNYNHNHPCNMMKVFFSFTVNPEDASYVAVLHCDDGMKLLKDG